MLQVREKENGKSFKFDSVILLDYDTNDDVENTTKPLSHVSLIKKFIEEKHMKKFY